MKHQRSTREKASASRLRTQSARSQPARETAPIKRPSLKKPSLKKQWGQHHLRDAALCRPLLEYLRPAGQRVVEIGPGGGVLTSALVEAGARVIACEVDLEWAFELRRRHLQAAASGAVFSVLAADAQQLQWSRLPAPTLVTGNLPFNVATRLIESLLPHASQVPCAAFMVQKEVADRLVAGPGDPAYGSLSVLVAAQAQPQYLGTVRPGSFNPPPKVAAAFVGLSLQAAPVAATDWPQFAWLVRQAFSLRRKTLRNALRAGLGKRRVSDLLAAVGWGERCRAQELSLARFIELFEAYRRLEST
ncbi:MAG: 16S rRNA (adenine(1518)-N(6)/adenine(1519)-N(6))-dimethyltransferase RsmA [Acidobacteriota bacterium]